MGTIPASENVFPIVRVAEVAAPSTPPSGEVHLYAKSSKLLFWKDDAGTEYPVSQAADLAAHLADTTAAHAASAIAFTPTGTVASTNVQDAIAEAASEAAAGGIPSTLVDAKGDIVTATADNTAARLAVGTNDHVLHAASGQSTGLIWKRPRILNTFVRRASGDLTITNDTSWHDVPTIGDLTIAAASGDILEVIFSSVTSQSCRFDVQLVTSGNYVGDGVGASSQGIAGWANRAAAAAPVGGCPIPYTVVSGDISSGNVALRLRYTTNGSGATTLFAGSTVGPLIFLVKNLGQ